MCEDGRKTGRKCHLEDLLQGHRNLGNLEDHSHKDTTPARADWCGIHNVPITVGVLSIGQSPNMIWCLVCDHARSRGLSPTCKASSVSGGNLDWNRCCFVPCADGIVMGERQVRRIEHVLNQDGQIHEEITGIVHVLHPLNTKDVLMGQLIQHLQIWRTPAAIIEPSGPEEQKPIPLLNRQHRQLRARRVAELGGFCWLSLWNPCASASPIESPAMIRALQL
mmetsp:Transcript_84987/g.134579  ORF Transcript_84987/g.134579 Transcript_84987/m.134579 type:complete len:222 (-) Transcript_84987:183-848(-)